MTRQVLCVTDIGFKRADFPTNTIPQRTCLKANSKTKSSTPSRRGGLCFKRSKTESCGLERPTSTPSARANQFSNGAILIKTLRREPSGGSAFAEGQVDGRTIGQIVGVSGRNTPGVKIPGNRTFKTGVDGFDRAFDTEVAVFENLATKLRPGDRGTIRIFSERPFCESCSDVIRQFRDRFPGMDLIPSTGP